MNVKEINEIMRKIHEDAKFMDNCLNVELGGFLTLYTKRIIKLTEQFTEESIKRRIRKKDNERINNLMTEKQQKEEWEKWITSYRFYFKNSSEFRKKAREIFKEILI